MKIRTKDHSLVSNISAEPNQFKIAVTAKAFEALSSNLYRDKPLAVVRELVCNARDSHRDAGNTDPIEVHVPSYMNPTLIVRDKGTGMSHYKVMQLYTTYFQSDRATSDAFTGGFGLGSKSPYAITDQFTVVSTKRGIKSTYLAFKSSEGFPSIMRVERTKTDEPSGVEIQVPVEPTGLYIYGLALDKVAGSLDHPVLCAEKILPTTEYLLSFELSNGWKAAVRKGTQHYGHRVIMAGVAYPAPFPSEVFTDMKGSPQGYRIDWHVSPGTFQPTVSRESLEWDPSIIDVVKSALGELTDKLCDHAQMTIESQPSWFEANTTREALRLQAGVHQGEFSWHGIKLGKLPPDHYPGGVIVKVLHRGKRKLEVGSEVLYTQGLPNLVYWASKPNPLGSATAFGDAWYLVLFGDRDAAQAFLDQLGIGHLPLQDARGLRTISRRAYKPRESAPRVMLSGGEHIHLTKSTDCHGWLLNSKSAALGYLEDWGMVEPRAVVVEIETQQARASKMILAQGGCVTSSDYVKKYGQIDREVIAQRLGFHLAQARHVYSDHWLVDKLLKLNWPISSKLRLLVQEPVRTLPTHWGAEQATRIFESYCDSTTVSKWEKYYAKGLVRQNALVEKFKQRNAETVGIIRDYNDSRVLEVIKKLVR